MRIRRLVRWEKEEKKSAGRGCNAVFPLLWECNSRYLVVYFPFLILLACDGFFWIRWRCLKNAIEWA